MQVQVIYGSQITSKELLHTKLSELLYFTSHYGNNLDALYDCLCERTLPTELMICEKETLYKNLEQYGKQFIRVLEDASLENPLLTIKYF